VSLPGDPGNDGDDIVVDRVLVDEFGGGEG